ncbi:hypothetical protein Y886_42395, partial [Xanthomonas hyacinthi DSM 19077]
MAALAQAAGRDVSEAMASTAASAAPLWSAEQHGWLQALGYTLYVGADADVGAVVAQAAQAEVGAAPAADAAAGACSDSSAGAAASAA